MSEVRTEPVFMQNRELSWLRFNELVLEESTDESVPLLERLKFIAIFSSNLDEFFMIRVGSLFDVLSLKEETVDTKTGLTAYEQLGLIYHAVSPLYLQREEILAKVEEELREYGICRLRPDELEQPERAFIHEYFNTHIEPVISPQIIDTHHPFPHFSNKMIHVCAMLRSKDKELFGVVPLPESLPPVVYLPGSDVRYILTEDVVRMYLEHLFNMYDITESTFLCLTRNADIHTDEDAIDVDLDFRNTMRQLLMQRQRMAPVRLELSNRISMAFERYLCEKLGIAPQQIYISEAPMKMSYVFGLEHKLAPNVRTMLTYDKFTPCWPKEIVPGESVLKQVMKKDFLLSYPYESMEPFLQLIREASEDPAVASIKITIYRLAKKAKLVEYLCAAAENGKDVTVLIELRARFDEQNNIDWSERLEEAGCRIIYGIEGYKVHSKICLITRRDKGGYSYITQIGTGNYNEKTAASYTDVCLLTADRRIGQDAAEFFKNMAIGNLNGNYQHLLVAPVSLKSSVLSLIQEEMDKGKQGRITLKLNSITDADIIRKLADASQAGVRVSMLVRGICCILPGVAERTENVFVSNIVGRFLEHSRVYCFGQGAEEKMYISSADLMTRNTERRIEIACPLYSPEIRQKVRYVIQTNMRDNVQGRTMDRFGVYHKKPPTVPPVDSQRILMTAARAVQPSPQEKKSVLRRLRGLFGK